MRLQRLTGLERDKLEAEYQELLKTIAYLKSILESEEVLKGVIRDELKEVKKTYATPRRTQLLDEDPENIDIEDLIPDEDTVITLSRRGYVKRTPLSNYQAQRRGGKGIAGVQTGDGDFVHTFLLTTNHQTLTLFTNLGRMYQLKVHQVPEGSRYAKGAHIANLLPLSKDEYIATAVSLREFLDEEFFLFVTKRGMVKRTSVGQYRNCRSTGIKAVVLKEGDELIAVRRLDKAANVLLVTRDGLSIRFDIQDARAMGRTTAGVKGIALKAKDEVVSCVVSGDPERDQVLTRVLGRLRQAHRDRQVPAPDPGRQGHHQHAGDRQDRQGPGRRGGGGRGRNRAAHFGQQDHPAAGWRDQPGRPGHPGRTLGQDGGGRACGRVRPGAGPLHRQGARTFRGQIARPCAPSLRHC